MILTESLPVHSCCSLCLINWKHRMFVYIIGFFFPFLFVLQLSGTFSGTEATKATYYQTKMAAGCYQRAMQQFMNALQGGGLGTWLRKPPELGHFHA